MFSDVLNNPRDLISEFDLVHFKWSFILVAYSGYKPQSLIFVIKATPADSFIYEHKLFSVLQVSCDSMVHIPTAKILTPQTRMTASRLPDRNVPGLH